jgi:hypothetical protein
MSVPVPIWRRSPWFHPKKTSEVGLSLVIGYNRRHMTTVRRVRRIIRKIDPWTVLKVSSLFNVVAGLGIVLGLVMFWSVLTAAGIPDRIVDVLVRITLLEEGENPFANTERFLRAAVFGSIVWAVLATGLMTLAAVMYNLISDVVGGVEVVVLEESLAPVAAVPTNSPTPRRWTPAAPNGAKTEPSVVAETPTEEVPAI